MILNYRTSPCTISVDINIKNISVMYDDIRSGRIPFHNRQESLKEIDRVVEKQVDIVILEITKNIRHDIANRIFEKIYQANQESE